MKVKIKYNVPIGDFRAIERTETFYAVSKWEVEGTSLIYFKTDRYNVRTVCRSEIVSILFNKEEAIRFLTEIGWNYYGAEAIVETALEDGVELSEEKLKSLSEDYKDR